MSKIIIFIFSIIYAISTFAQEKTINLNVTYKYVNYTGKTVKAIAVNDQIPAPTLHFKEGDLVTINVQNQLQEETALHWHGILVPWQMDGVLGVSQQGIKPGKIFKYRFKLLQSGTYWYHAHSSLQEQQGLYGAFIIDPIKTSNYRYNNDYVIVLSDWSNTHPEQILANLKKDGDYYAAKFPLQPSLLKFIHDYRKRSASERQHLINEYKMMQQMRMSIYDINDIAYDAFLLNGQPLSQPWEKIVRKSDTVRLRFIGAGTETIFRVKIPHALMQIIHIQGNDIKPYYAHDFTIAPGETVDVIIKISHDYPYVIYAESFDKVGRIYGVLKTNKSQIVNLKTITPFNEPSPIVDEMLENMMRNSNQNSHHEMMDHEDDKHSMAKTMNMNMSMPIEPTSIGDKILANINSSQMPTNTHTYGTKYQHLKSAYITNNPKKPIAGIINMELFGYMNRFIWMINGLTEYEAKPIILDPNKRYRFIFTNNSMMRHPMHIHGHWFILRNGNEAYDPLLHTILIPPGATVTADIDTEASGQWFFHCHMNYHMTAGMSRVFQYSTLIALTQHQIKPEHIERKTEYYNRPIVRIDETRPIDFSLVSHPMAHHAGFWSANYLDVGFNSFDNIQRLSFKGLYGPDYHKLQLLIEDAEMNKGVIENADVDLFYWRLINQFWAIKMGGNYFYRPSISPYWQIGFGVEGLMPYFIETDLRTYLYKGSFKLDLELSRDTQITNNFLIHLALRSIAASKTIQTPALIGKNLNQMRYIIKPYYRITPGLNIYVEYEYERNYGVYKEMLKILGEASSQNTLTLGLNYVF